MELNDSPLFFHLSIRVELALANVGNLFPVLGSLETPLFSLSDIPCA